MRLSGGRFDDAALVDPVALGASPEWITEGAAGEVITDLIPTTSSKVRLGLDLGRS